MPTPPLRRAIPPGAPGTYESGGPTDNVLPIWKAAAPALDILAPDIYVNDSAEYLKVMDLYHRDDNALFVPETGHSAERRPLPVFRASAWERSGFRRSAWIT